MGPRAGRDVDNDAKKKSVPSRESQFPGHLTCSLVTILTELTLPFFHNNEANRNKRGWQILRIYNNF
jgi:hypothetical protein